LPRSKKSYEPETSVCRDQQQRYPQPHAIVEGPTKTRVFIVSPGSSLQSFVRRATKSNIKIFQRFHNVTRLLFYYRQGE
jgi:hypothetical protein